MLAAGFAVLMVPVAASGAALTLGGPLSQLCHQSALARDSRNTSVESCTRSLQEESLSTPRPVGDARQPRDPVHDPRQQREGRCGFRRRLARQRLVPRRAAHQGFLRLRQGNGRDALLLLEEGIKRQPRREALAYFARGLAHEDLGNFDAAYADLRRARELEPKWPLPKEYLARYQVRDRRRRSDWKVVIA